MFVFPQGGRRHPLFPKIRPGKLHGVAVRTQDFEAPRSIRLRPEFMAQFGPESGRTDDPALAQAGEPFVTRRWILLGQGGKKRRIALPPSARVGQTAAFPQDGLGHEPIRPAPTRKPKQAAPAKFTLSFGRHDFGPPWITDWKPDFPGEGFIGYYPIVHAEP